MTATATASTRLELRGATKSFPTTGGRTVRAVRGIDLDIERGSTVALLGPNGAGKSTTIDMLLGLTRPDSGTVRVFGEPPQEAVGAGRVGAMLQVGQLIDGAQVRELVAMAASLYPDPLDVDATLELCELTEIAERRTDRLSGGQAQRVRFAVALVGNPELLVLDEPTAAMDVESRRVFWRSMQRFTERGTTVLFATHYLEEADEFADRVVLMARGRVVADGSPAQIKAQVAQRTLRATVPGATDAALGRLDGVTDVQLVGDVATLRCSDSDAAIRALLAAHPAARDIEIHAAALDDAFVQLTADTDRDDEGVDG
jgi:ABC-2 type transport system ATP-binding protein